MPHPRLCLVLALGTAFAGVAQAATITQDISLAAFSTSHSANQYFDVTPFNPKLGTLTSVTTTLNGTYDASIPQLGEDNAFFFIQFTNQSPFPDQLIGLNPGFHSTSGQYSVSGTATDSVARDLADLSGASPVQLEFTASEDEMSSISGSDFTVTLTYDYTPAVTVAATPEPSSLALLGTGLAGLTTLVRRRRRV